MRRRAHLQPSDLLLLQVQHAAEEARAVQLPNARPGVQAQVLALTDGHLAQRGVDAPPLLPPPRRELRPPQEGGGAAESKVRSGLKPAPPHRHLQAAPRHHALHRESPLVRKSVVTELPKS
eukprot:7072067-Pyramimonas_sp.AAC.1